MENDEWRMENGGIILNSQFLIPNSITSLPSV